MNDSDRHIRALATLELIRRGKLPNLRLLQQLLKSSDRLDNYPYAAKSSIGIQGTHDQIFEAIASQATPEVFAVLLQFPLSTEYDHDQKIFPALGASLRRHPMAADLLLKARDADDSNRQRDFVRDVFCAAGKELLPKLHAALTSNDRVIRSNAARVCGAIGDPSSIAPLIKAVDLESGLSRASIVWALGELKAKESLTVLANLYAAAKQDETSPRRSGVYAAQQAAAVTSQYERLSNLEALGADWDELKTSALAPPVDPENQEELLQTEHLLEAIAKIGPEWSQTFYRSLAASKDAESRAEAAKQLAAGKGDDQAQSLALLKSLLKDSAVGVRAAAAVSLIQINDTSGRDVILEALNTSNSGDKYEAIQQLNRLTQASHLEFAKARLQAISTDRSLVIGLRQSAGRLLERLKP